LVLLLGAAMTAAGALRAEQKAMPVIDFFGSADAHAPYLAAFLEGLRGRPKMN